MKREHKSIRSPANVAPGRGLALHDGKRKTPSRVIKYILDNGQKVCHLKSKPLKISMLYAISEVKTEHYYFHVLQVALEDCRRFHEIVTKQRNT